MIQPVIPRRSLLFVPASNTRALEKARGLSADGIIIDLEDAVAPTMKEAARERAEAAIAVGFGGRTIALRINDPDTPQGESDLKAALRCLPEAIVLPKVSHPDTIRKVSRRLDEAGAPPALRIWAMIETARAVLNADAIASSAQDPENRLDLLIIGANDLARETRVKPAPDRAPLLPWLQHVLLAARANDLDIIDSVYNDFADADGFTAECRQGRTLGFDGKTLIHPAQIGPANTAFGPSPEEVGDAHAMIAAFSAPENANLGAVSYKGRMIEELHIVMARRTVALSEAIAKLHET